MAVARVPFFQNFNLLAIGSDIPPVRAMRARLMMKIMGLIVMIVLTIVSAHSCSASPPSSPLDPATLGHNGLAGLCADQEATAEASGQDSTQTLQIPDSSGGLSNLAGAAGLSPGTFDCPTTTVAGGN